MSKKKLFDDDSDEEVALKTENEYAKKYDTWRGKEELHKLEQKYGSNALNPDASDSSDSDESDEPPEVSEEMETQFLKTLALLKTKDPRIYDPGYKCFDKDTEKEKENKPEKKTLTFADSDDDDDDNGNIFTIEKKAEVTEDKGDSRAETQSKASTSKATKKGAKIKDYLIGKTEAIDNNIEQDLAPLKALWSDPKLNEGEAFLRDYILNQRYLEDGDAGEAEDKIRDDADLEADEEIVEEQGKFERAYNFRFEEPDEEYLKRFPRTMNYIRPKDDRRARQRAEIRERKEQEKKRKMEEIARLKALKLKEIQEKIARIKEVTGNDELGFKEEDIEGDFDPEAHDRRMKAIFDEEYYGDADDQKPVFPDLDEELEIENWDNYDPEEDREGHTAEDVNGTHCEDEDFNMDADYDPKQQRANLLAELKSTQTKKRRNRKKKTKLHQLLASEKPKFIPTLAEKTYNEYMEEYYKMDCEDVIGGDLPTRFKYREVVPNDYGLSIEEILLADDKELTQWVPLKKIVKHRPDAVEKSEVNTYTQKAADVRLKRKILPSLFKDLPEEPEIAVPIEEATKKKKKKRKNKNKESNNSIEVTEETEPNSNENNEQNVEEVKTIVEEEVKTIVEEEVKTVEEREGAKKKRKRNKNKRKAGDSAVDVSVDVEENDSKKNNKNKHKTEESNHQNSAENNDKKDVIETAGTSEVISKKKHKKDRVSNANDVNNVTVHNGDSKIKKRDRTDSFSVTNVLNATPSQVPGPSNNIKPNLKRKLDTKPEGAPNKKKNKNNKNKQQFKNKFQQKDKNKNNKVKSDNPLSNLSDERLKAYGLNPKKYRGFLKYKKF